jgi:poly(A) polymerase
MAAPDPRPLAAQPWLVAAETRRLLTALQPAGAPVRFVGGCVRDGLLGRTDAGADLDLATPLLPDQVIACLERAGLRALPTGLDHGTVTALVDGRPFEITTLRRDLACDGRHAEVVFTEDFEEDAARRDFTINAMSADPEGHLFDYFGGREDLAAGRIRFVGEAASRVAEDYLRVLRFFRFYARYGRPPADPAALAACAAAAGALERLSGERIRLEMLKLLSAADPLPALTLMAESGVLGHLLPGPDSITLRPLQRLQAFTAEPDPLLRLAALLGEPARIEPLAARWRLANAESARLQRLLARPPEPLPVTAAAARRALYRQGPALFADRLRLSAAAGDDPEADLAEPLALAAALTPVPFPLTGQDLLERGVAAGPRLGALLARLETWWLDNNLRPDRAACLEALDRLLATEPKE